MPVVDRGLGATYGDMRRMDDVLDQARGLDWICLRPCHRVSNYATLAS